MYLVAVLLGKTISYLTKFFKIGGGSAAPGLIALKVYPDLVTKLGSNIYKNVIITGTNGKTTAAKMLSHFAKNSGLKVIRNHTGSNLERGITSTLIDGVNLSHPWGGLGRHLGIWELDEAAFNTVAPKLKPDIVVFLNVFRDQLDRYGEIDTVVKNWCQTLKTLPKQTLILVNGDDVNTLKLASCVGSKVFKFGVKEYKIIGESIEQLKGQENLDFEAENVRLKGLEGSTFTLKTPTQKLQIALPLPGIYHIYDALAAVACAYQLNLSIPKLVPTLKNYLPAFGRVEKLDFGYIFLIKNPAGATQVFETVAPNFKEGDRFLLALNDNIADGKDVSWIWDVNFEVLQNSLNLSERAKGSLTSPNPRDNIIYISGTRAHDLALRLKYAGFNPNSIQIEPDLVVALKEARSGLKGKLYIFPTYTAMLELQSILVKSGIKKHYWKESD